MTLPKHKKFLIAVVLVNYVQVFTKHVCGNLQLHNYINNSAYSLLVVNNSN